MAPSLAATGASATSPLPLTRGADASRAPLISDIVPYSASGGAGGARHRASSVHRPRKFDGDDDKFEVIHNGTRFEETSEAISKVKFFRDPELFSFDDNVYVMRNKKSDEIVFCYAASDGRMHELTKSMMQHYVGEVLRMTPAQIVAARNLGSGTREGRVLVPTWLYSTYASDQAPAAATPVAKAAARPFAAPAKTVAATAAATTKPGVPRQAAAVAAAGAGVKIKPSDLVQPCTLRDIVSYELLLESSPTWNVAFARSGHEIGEYLAASFASVITGARSSRQTPAWHLTLRAPGESVAAAAPRPAAAALPSAVATAASSAPAPVSAPTQAPVARGTASAGASAPARAAAPLAAASRKRAHGDRTAFEWLDTCVERICDGHAPRLEALFDGRDLDISASLVAQSAAAFASGAALARSNVALSKHEFSQHLLDNPFFRNVLCPVYAESAPLRELKRARGLDASERVLPLFPGDIERELSSDAN